MKKTQHENDVCSFSSSSCCSKPIQAVAVPGKTGDNSKLQGSADTTAAETGSEAESRKQQRQETKEAGKVAMISTPLYQMVDGCKLLPGNGRYAYEKAGKPFIQTMWQPLY